jgi:uncharacterized protein
MPLRLHIFEDRYRAMIERSLATNRIFGVNLIRSGEESQGPLPIPHPTGCTARIVQVEQLADGRYNLTVVGDERYQVLRMGLADPYLTAFVESTPLQSHHSMDVILGIRSLRIRVTDYLALLSAYIQSETKNTESEVNVNLQELELPEDPMMMIYLAASLLQIPAEEKQPLLETDTGSQLLEMLQRLYRRELAVLPPMLQVSDEQAQMLAWAN